MNYLKRFFAAASKTVTAYLALAISGLAILPEMIPQYWDQLCGLLPASWPRETFHHILLGLGALAVIWTRVRRQIGTVAPVLLALSTLPILGACGSSSEAQTATRPVTVSWTNPTARSDGSAYNAATDQASVLISYGTTKGGPYPNSATSAGAGTSLVIQVPSTPACGAWYFVAVASDVNGLASPPSAEATRVYPCAPGAPTGLTAK